MCYLILGGVVGFLAGLLGIGGGGIMVPILTSLFLWQGVSLDHVIHLALGTSMAAIVMTSYSSMRAHHRKKTLQWSIVRQMVPGIIIGTLFATFFLTHLSSLHLSIFFTVFMACIALQMFLNITPKPTRTLPSAYSLALVGSIIGALSALVAIGGGALSVPYMNWHNVELKKAISTSAAIAFFISLAGSIAFIINGLYASPDLPYTVGFVNVVALLCIVLVSYCTAPFGVYMAHRMPTAILKKLFALLLMILSLKMLFFIHLS